MKIKGGGRDGVHEDVIKKGDLEVAKAMKEFRDRIHPLKTESKLPSHTPKSPPSQ